MRHFEESIELTSAKTVSLYVLDCNAPAIKFYTKQGFTFGNRQQLDNYQEQTIIDVQMIKNVIKSSQ